MNKKHNIIVIVIFATLFFAVSVANILQPTRATFSEEEKRELSRFPEFSLESLTNGKFFAGIDSFISDTFIFRSELIQASRKINSLWSASTFFGTDENSIIFISTDTPSIDIDVESPLLDIETDKDKEKPPVHDKTEEPKDTENDEPTINVDPEDKTDINETPKEPTEDKTDISETTETPPEDPNKPEENTTQEPEPTISPAVTPDPGNDLTEIEDPLGVGEPEFLASGHIIYNNAVYSIPYLVKSVAEYYADVVSYYKYLFPNARVSTLSAPLSSSMLTIPSLKNKITDQNKMIDTINSYLEEDINGVNCFDEMFEHRKEYLYFRSDHHWTARGAYYAYTAFIKSIGIDPVPLENFKEEVLNSSWKGTMYGYTGDERVKEFTDEVYAYIPTKKHTMTTYNRNGEASKYNTSILTSYRSYDAFLDGDNPYTIINVPENPNDMTILVLKDSYGRAMIPFLIEHYSTIIVVDPRYIYFDIYELLKDYPLTDILFLNNLYNPNVLSYPKNLMRAVGK